MHRRVVPSSLVLAAVAVGLAPGVASAATLTVDAASADTGCNASGVCKTLASAIAAVADGDTITVKPGTYNEAAKLVLTKKNVTIQGTPGQTTVTPAVATAGEAAITLTDGDILDGITVITARNAGPGVLAAGLGTTFRNGAVVRLAPTTADAAAIKVDTPVAGGTTTISRSTILNGPAGTTGQKAAAIAGNETSSIALSESIVVSGAGQGPALSLIGNAVSGTDPVTNTVTRSALQAANSASDAVSLVGGATSTRKKALTIDSSILLGGSQAAGISAQTSTAGVPPNPLPIGGSTGDTSGDVSVLARHVTIMGSKYPFFVDAKALGSTAVGNISVVFDRSIVHGTDPGSVDSAMPVLGALGAANTATVTIRTSDTNTGAASTKNGGKATIVTSGNSNTPDDQLFVDAAKRNLHLKASAPVIDKGGEILTGEADKDIDGDPRKVGAGTDLGADEFANHAPKASAKTSVTTARQNQAVTFDATASSDPDGAGMIAKYQWTFGDGTTAETVTPTTTHAYATVGSYTPTLTVVDAGGAPSTAFTLPAVTITDGTPPVVTITKPASGASFSIFRSKKVGKRTVKTLSGGLVAKVAFAGGASDDSGVKTILLSIRRVAVGTATPPASPTTCVYLSADKKTFRTSSCKKPISFTVPITNGSWAYHLSSKLRPKAGRYEISALAIDGAGVPSAPVSLPFRLK